MWFLVRFVYRSIVRSCNSPGGDSCQHASRKRRRGMIEKKRRDRINASLGELRRLVPAAARDPHSGKLEKAEILQLTVEHLRTLRNKGECWEKSSSNYKRYVSEKRTSFLSLLPTDTCWLVYVTRHRLTIVRLEKPKNHLSRDHQTLTKTFTILSVCWSIAINL